MNTAAGTLPNGLVLDGVTHKDFVLREASVGDMLDAEAVADVNRPLTFNAQMMAVQLVSVGTFNGPFTIGMIRSLKPADYRELRAKQMVLDALGEPKGAPGKPVEQGATPGP